jgi:3-methyladenine DNA glycosylase AlkD
MLLFKRMAPWIYKLFLPDPVFTVFAGSAGKPVPEVPEYDSKHHVARHNEPPGFTQLRNAEILPVFDLKVHNAGHGILQDGVGRGGILWGMLDKERANHHNHMPRHPTQSIMLNGIIHRIRQDLSSSADPATRKSFPVFFREGVRYYGVKTAVVRQIAGKYWKEIQNRSKPEIFALCEELYRSDFTEEAFIVSFWVPRVAHQYEREDLSVFERWIDTYINNWAKCDGFCNHAMGDFFQKFPDRAPDLRRWAGSENRWMRRAAAVSLIVPAKHGEFLSDALAIAGLLLTDPDDLVQKGYGWLLKEASRKHTDEVFDFVMQNKKMMPRTALRYAIELMPTELRAEAMKKDW